MFHNRKLMFGTPPDECEGGHAPDFEEILDPDEVNYGSDEIIAFNGETVVPVIARPYAEARLDKDGVDHSAEIVMGDVPEGVSLDAFDRTQAEYNGLDRRATPMNSYDSVSGEDYSHSYM